MPLQLSGLYGLGAVTPETRASVRPCGRRSPGPANKELTAAAIFLLVERPLLTTGAGPGDPERAQFLGERFGTSRPAARSVTQSRKAIPPLRSL